MNRFPLIRLGISGLLVALVLTACGARADVAASRSSDERLQQYATVLDMLRTHQQADRVQIELGSAGTWLRRAESAAGNPDYDADEFDLLLDVVDGQLVRVKSALARYSAEADLEQGRATYESQMRQVDQIRREADGLRDQEGPQ